MDTKLIDEKIRQLRERETHLRAEIDRLMRLRKNEHLMGSTYKLFELPKVCVESDVVGGWNAEIGTLQDSLRSALDRAYAARGISRVEFVA